MPAERLSPTTLAAVVALALVCAPRGLSAQPARPGDRLPEDPVAGAKSTQQWREHLVEEEHERKLHYDRDRLKKHRAVVKFLVATRARYDRAKTKAAVTAFRARLPPAVDGVRKQITAIDKWGTNSNLLDDFDRRLAHINAWLAEAAESKDE